MPNGQHHLAQALLAYRKQVAAHSDKLSQQVPSDQSSEPMADASTASMHPAGGRGGKVKLRQHSHHCLIFLHCHKAMDRPTMLRNKRKRSGPGPLLQLQSQEKDWNHTSMTVPSVGSSSEDGDGHEIEVGRPDDAAQTGVTYDSSLRPGTSSGVGESSRGVGSASLAEP